MIDIEKNLPHEVAEVVCLKCLKRWIAIFPEKTLLKDLQCPKCEAIGYVIKTGQTLPKMPDPGMGNRKKGKIKDIPPEEERPGSLIRVPFSLKNNTHY